jgi:bacillithiol biosynthesis deacetylase BshB2
MERHVLVVLAHPDDESFGAGGTIALHSRRGTPVTYVCATRGEMGRHMGRPPFANRETLPILREQELRTACQALGIGDLRLLGIRDKTVEFVEPQWLADRVRAVIDEVHPSLVITFHPQHGNHPDHNAIGAATIRAVAAMPTQRRPVVNCIKNQWAGVELDLETVTVDISSVLDVKEAAIRAHRSQSEGIVASWEARFKDNPEALAAFMAARTKEYYWVYKF